MISIILAFHVFASAEIKTSSPVEDAAPSSSAQALADKLSQFSQCAKDPKVWPKTMFHKNPMAFVDENGTPWRWSADTGLVAVTDAADAATIKKLSQHRVWTSNDQKNPPEVILNMGISKANVEKKTGQHGGAGSQQPKPKPSKECKAAADMRAQLTQNIPKSAGSDFVTETFKLGVHESMHIHDQNNPTCWKHTLDANSASMERINSYPLDAKPRQMRYKLKVALRRALEAPAGAERQKYLEEAAHWHKTYKAQYKGKEEFEGPDIFEGSARYIDLVATKIDCSKPVTAEHLAKASREAVLEGVDEQPQPTADTEAYFLGALSGALLDQRAIDWKSKTTKGVSPLDQLLDNVRPSTGALKDSKRLDNVAAASPNATEACAVKPDFEYLKNAKDSKKYAWVSVPTSRYMGQGAYDGKSVLPTSKKVLVDSTALGGTMKAEKMPLVVSNDNPCGGANAMMVLVERESIVNGSVNFSRDGNEAAKVSGSVETSSRSSSLGDVYCGK